MALDRHPHNTVDDPVAFVADFGRAWNADNESAIMAFFTDDAVVRLELASHGPVVYEGEAVRNFVQTYPRDFKAESNEGSIHTEAEGVRWVWVVSGQAFQERGVEHVDVTVSAVLRERKIAAFTLTEDVPESDRMDIGIRDRNA
jgi:hypothetical protein